MEFKEVEVGLSKEMPSKIVLYGVPKIGKSRLAAEFTDAFFINVEDGLNYIGKKVRSTPKLSSYEDVIAWLRHIYDNDDFKAGHIIVDSLDWVETLAQARLIKLAGANSITDPKCKEFAYNKGVDSAASDCFQVLKWLDAIYQKKGIKSVVIAHSDVKTVDLPNQDSFNRYQLKLSKQLSAKTNEWADAILFADYVFVVSKDGKTSEPRPMIRAGGSAAYVGGGRMLISKDIPLNYEQLVKELTQ